MAKQFRLVKHYIISPDGLNRHGIHDPWESNMAGTGNSHCIDPYFPLHAMFDDTEEYQGDFACEAAT